MRVLTLRSATLLLSFVSAAGAQEKPPPPNEPPQLRRASASRQGGKWSSRSHARSTWRPASRSPQRP
jgi:hypothetical protein